MAGKEVLVQGLIKRIGNGASTNIWQDRWIPMHFWQDRWIPMHFNAKPITPSEGQEVTLVSDLMLDSGQWNEKLIKSVFLPIDARAILRIPLRSQEEDWWAWEPEKFGDYTVKSAYRKLHGANTDHAGLVPRVSNDASWSKLWKLNVPPKVKVFW
jgi:hypothetical protein